MNWLTKIKVFGDKIKRNLQKKFPTKEEIANSVERKIQVKDSIVSKGWLQNAKLKKIQKDKSDLGATWVSQ